MRLPILLAIAIAFTVSFPVRAQDDNDGEPYYVVQEGDSLWQIAARFGITLEELQEANGITDPEQVLIGAQLIIPGLSGVTGRLETVIVSYGDTLKSLSRRYKISELSLAEVNRFVSPAEFYTGSTVIVPVNENQRTVAAVPRYLAPGESLLELAIRSGSDPWSLTLDNRLSGAWLASPGDALRVEAAVGEGVVPGLPEGIEKVDIEPLLMGQGNTTVIKVYTPASTTVRGSLGDRNLNFFAQDYGYVALQGIHAMTLPGLYPLRLEGEMADGRKFAFSQNVLIQDASFPYDPTLEVDPVTIDPAVTEPEKALWESLAIPVTPEKMWDGIFASPVPGDLKECWTSFFGNRRSYNNGAYDSFHSGLDFCGRVGTELYAVAPGRVVYTDNLVVRGGVVVIDHGWGVYTAYDHLSEVQVQPGMIVQPGQVIGLGGDTGRTTGPHLHWEVWVGGVQVNPIDWLNRSFP